MSDFNEGTGLDIPDSGDKSEASSNIFLNMAETDSTGIPSLKQAPESMISSSASESKLNTQIVIAACVLAIGGIAIYGMRYIGMQAGLDENITTIDYASESNNADFAKRFTSVMKTLDESSVSIQLANREEFPEKPFARPSREEENYAEPIDPGLSQEERDRIASERESERQIVQRKENVISEAFRFNLQGIIGGSRPAARISGIPVRKGMGLGEYFKVVEITGRSVIIEADGMRFELSIGQETVQLD